LYLHVLQWVNYIIFKWREEVSYWRYPVNKFIYWNIFVYIFSNCEKCVWFIFFEIISRHLQLKFPTSLWLRTFVLWNVWILYSAEYRLISFILICYVCHFQNTLLVHSQTQNMGVYIIFTFIQRHVVCNAYTVGSTYKSLLVGIPNPPECNLI